MPTGFDILAYNKTLRTYWKIRVIAGLIDILLIFVPSMILSMVIMIENLGKIIIFHILYYLYCCVTEGVEGKTLGKRIFRLKVVSYVGKVSFKQSMKRNLPKLFLPFLLLDILLALSGEEDPRQRLFDKFSDSLVIAERVERIATSYFSSKRRIIRLTE